MRLHALRLCNFRQHTDTVIEFDGGLTGIIGPNGSGKSTILEAIAWALYGTPAARGTRESIRSHRAPARATVKVALDFELGGHRYHVERGLTSAELYLDGAAVPIANSITGVTELLRRRIGMSLEEFFNTYFTGQKELSVMAAMGAAERAQFLSRVLGYDRLRTAQASVRERRRMIVAESTGLRAGMPDAEAVARALADAELRVAAAQARLQDAASRRAAAHRRLEAIAPQWDAAQREREVLQTVLAELRVADGEFAARMRDITRLDAELALIAGAQTELDELRTALAPLANLAAQLPAMDRLHGEERRRQTLTDAHRALADDLARLRERRERLESAPGLAEETASELEHRRGELETAEAAHEAARTDWVRDRQEAETKKAELLRQYQELKQQRELLIDTGEDGTCPTCARPLGDHFRTVLDLVDSQLDTATVDGKYFRARIEQLEEAPAAIRDLDEQRRALADAIAKLERRLTKVQLAVQEIATVDADIAMREQRHAALGAELATIPAVYDALRHEALRSAAARVAPLEARAARLTAQIEREPQLRRDREHAGDSVAQTAATRDALTRQRDAIHVSDTDYAALRREYDDAAAELRSGELASATADGECAIATAARAHAETARGDLARTQQQLDALTHEKRLHDELDRAYGDMRTDLNLQLRPEISEVASVFLSELTDGRYAELELDDQYNIIVLEDGVAKPVISGGEEDVANLVLRLAISQMIAERAGQSFSLLVLDEVFGSLDESRRHNVVELLRRLQDRFEQVILITHIESVREGLDRVITVRYDEDTGSSRVVQERPDDRALPLPDAMPAGAAT